MSIIIFSSLLFSAAFAGGKSRAVESVIHNGLISAQIKPLRPFGKFLKKQFQVHDIYSSNNNKSAVFVKWDVPKRKKNFIVTKMKRGTEVFLWKANYSVAFFFYNVPSDLVQNAIEILKVNSRSVASEVTSTSWSDDVTSDLSTNPGVDVGQILSVAKQCTLDVLGNAAGELWDGAKSTWDAVVLGFTDPGAFWDAAVEKYNAMAEVIENIGGHLATLWEALKGMGWEEFKAVACQIVGMVSGMVVTAVITGGAATTKLGLRIAQIVSSVAKMSGVLKAYSTLQPAAKALFPLDTMIEAAFSRYGDKVIGWANKFLEKGDKHMALKVMACEVH